MQGADLQVVLAELSPPARLAAAHAPAAARGAWIVFLALDERLGRIVANATEPMLAQLRLAWWRDRLRESPERRPRGEPLLALLPAWEAELPALEALVDGWEAMVGEAGPPARSALAEARVEAILALARLVGARDDPLRVEAAARRWAQAESGSAVPLGRAMRPLAILAALAGGDRGLRAWLRIVRLGLLGR